MPKNFEKMSLEELLAWIDTDSSDDANTGKAQQNEGMPSVNSIQQGSDTQYTSGGDRNIATEQKHEGYSMQEQFGAQPGTQPEAQTGAVHRAQSRAQSGSRPETMNVKAPGIKLDFSKESLLQGILFSEILGKPRAKRYTRW